jgi:hypothetical protein
MTRDSGKLEGLRTGARSSSHSTCLKWWATLSTHLNSGEATPHCFLLLPGLFGSRRAAGAQLRRFDLGLTGFEPDRLEAILAGLGSSGLTDPDSVPEVSAKPVSRLGDIWLLDKHRVGCGDSTSEADVGSVLAGAAPHLMVTDPPYGVEYDPAWRASRNQSGGKLARGKVLNDDRADWQEAYALFPGDVAYVWFGALNGEIVGADLATCGFRLRAQIVWAKQHFALSRGYYHWQHECCWYAVRDGKTRWQGDRTQTTLWEIANNNPFGNQNHAQSWGHGTIEVVELGLFGRGEMDGRHQARPRPR